MNSRLRPCFPRRTHRWAHLAAGVAFAASSLPALAQAYPSKPVRFIVPSAPGAAADILARAIAPGMGQFLGQPVIIENKTGAGSLIGFEYVAKGVPADGYTGIIAATTGLAILPVITKDLRFDPVKDLHPVINLAEARLIFGSPSKAPWKTLAELVAYAKANPGKLNHGGSNATVRFWNDALIRGLGIDVAYIPYKDSATYYTSLTANEIQMGFAAESSAIAMGDKFRALATTGETRIPTAKDVPTLTELGHPQIRGVGYALDMPAATPRAIMEKVHDAAAKTLRQPDINTRLKNMGLEADGGTMEAAVKRLADEASVLAKIAKATGFQMQ